jgi:hypothetical protein
MENEGRKKMKVKTKGDGKKGKEKWTRLWKIGKEKLQGKRNGREGENGRGRGNGGNGENVSEEKKPIKKERENGRETIGKMGTTEKEQW